MPPKKKPTPVKDFFSGLWKVIVNVSQAIYSVIKTIFCAIHQFLKLIFDLLKTLFLGLSALIGALALFIFAVCIGIYFLGETFGLSESPAFQETRDSWITVNTFAQERLFLEHFNTQQMTLPEAERFSGELPQLVLTKDENEARLKALIEYLSAREEEEMLQRYID